MGEKKANSPENLAGEALLRREIDRISALVSLSYSIRVFVGKWQIIRNKLNELNSSLIAAEGWNDATKNRAFLDLVCGVISTVSECNELAGRCINDSYSGKLLMQSDLDLVIGKLDTHLRNLSGIYSLGLLSNGFALVVSKPGPGSTREDMKFYVTDLYTRLKIGDREMKFQALSALNEIVIEDEKYMNILVVGNEGLILLLAGLLDYPDPGIQEEGSKLVSVLSGSGLNRTQLVKAGMIPPLIRVLENAGDKGKEYAARSLLRLTQNSDNAWCVSAHGGVSVLLNLCCKEEFKAELVGLACGVLKNLVAVEEVRRFMVEEGAISTFIKLVNVKDEAVQIGSIGVLNAMAFGDDMVLQMIIKEGGVQVLVRIIDPNSSFPYKSREIALRAIENLCFSSISNVHLLVTYGFLDHLLFFLRKGEAPIQELALKAASRLSGSSEEAKKAMGEAGFIQEFTRFLEGKSYEIREMAAEALASMVMIPKNKKKFVQEDKNIGLLMKLLDPNQGNQANYKLLLSILMSISNCSNARKKIMNSGYMKIIEKLADSGVSDAKKIVRKLSTSRLKSMLTGLWHS